MAGCRLYGTHEYIFSGWEQFLVDFKPGVPCFTVLMCLWNFDLYQIICPPESLPCRTVLSFCDGRMISL